MRSVLAIFLLLASAGISVAQDEPTLTVDRDTLYRGESLLLTLAVPGAEAATVPDLSSVPCGTPRLIRNEAKNHYQISIVNGRMERQGFSGRIYTYALEPRDAGRFRIGPVQVDAGGRLWTLPGPWVTVHEIPPQDQAFLEIRADPETVLPGEPFTVTVVLRVKQLPPPYGDAPPFLPGSPPLLDVPFLQPGAMPDLDSGDPRDTLARYQVSAPSPGFRINDYAAERSPFDGGLFDFPDFFGDRRSTRNPLLFLPPAVAVTTNETTYLEYRISHSFTAPEEGAFVFGPVRFKGPVLTGVNDAGQAESLAVYTIAPPLSVRVGFPPRASWPTSFFGLYGSNLVADAQLSAGVCRVGDPIRVTLKIRGSFLGRHDWMPNLDAVSNLTDRFQLYGSTLQADHSDDGRDYTFTLRPRETGTLEFPALPIAWYDTHSRQFRLTSTAPVPLKVEPASELKAGAWLEKQNAFQESAADGQRWENVPAGIRPIPNSLRMAPSAPWTLALALAGPVFFLATVLNALLQRLARRLDAWRRRRSAVPRAIRELRRLRVHPPPEPQNAARAAYQIVCQCVSVGFDQDPVSLTPDRLRHLLETGPFPTADAHWVADAASQLFASAYSPRPRTEAVQTILDQLPERLRLFDRTRGAVGRGPIPSAVRRALFMAFLAGSTIAACGDDRTAASRLFLWEEANARAAQAVTPADFKQAAEQYAELAALGIRHGDLFYNLGVCLLFAGEPREAEQALLRAERYLGRPPDLAQTLALAQQAARGDMATGVPWNRIVWAFHYAIPLGWRLRLAAIGLLLFCVAGAAWRLRRTRRRRHLMNLGLVLLLFFGTSAGVTGFLEHQETLSPLPLAPPSSAGPADVSTQEPDPT